MKKCESILIRLIVKEYDEDGNQVNEGVTTELRVFRKTHPDIWKTVDESLKKANES